MHYTITLQHTSRIQPVMCLCPEFKTIAIDEAGACDTNVMPKYCVLHAL